MNRSDATSSGLGSVKTSFSMGPVGVLSAILIVGAAVLYRGVAPTKSVPEAAIAPARLSPPVASDVIVLRLERDGTCSLNGRSTPTIDLPPVLRDHSQKHAASALIVEVDPSLPAGALVEVMEMANVCGIKRTAVRRVHD